MKPDTFLNAVGMIDERYLDIETQKRRPVQHKWKKAAISVAAAAALVVCPLPALTAAGVSTAYEMLYHVAPSVAQTFKPVQKTCTDNGIEMTVISAERSGNEMSVYLAMRDLTGTCPDGEWDLYDSYDIHVRRDLAGHCSFSEYDADTHTAFFVVHLETMNGSDLPKGKVTFSVHEMLYGKNRSEGALDGIDMNAIPYEPETQPAPAVNGKAFYRDELDPRDYRFLIPAEEPLCAPGTGFSVMNIGYLDGALHILTRYEDIPHTDNHGFISLLDADGETVGEQTAVSFFYRTDTHTENYSEFMEQIIPVPYDQLRDCSLYGEFVSAQSYVSGNWEVTFPLA